MFNLFFSSFWCFKLRYHATSHLILSVASSHMESEMQIFRRKYNTHSTAAHSDLNWTVTGLAGGLWLVDDENDWKLTNSKTIQLHGYTLELLLFCGACEKTMMDFKWTLNDGTMSMWMARMMMGQNARFFTRLVVRCGVGRNSNNTNGLFIVYRPQCKKKRKRTTNRKANGTVELVENETWKIENDVWWIH